MWDWGKSKPIQTIGQADPNGNYVGMEQQLIYSPDGKTIAVPSGELLNNQLLFRIKFWDVLTGKQIGVTPLPANSEVQFMAFAPSGKLLAYSDFDGFIHLVDAATGHPIRKLHGDGPQGGVFAFSLDSDKVFGYTPATALIHEWSVALGKTLRKLETPLAQGVDSVLPLSAGVQLGLSLSPDGKTLVLFGTMGHIPLFSRYCFRPASR